MRASVVSSGEKTKPNKAKFLHYLRTQGLEKENNQSEPLPVSRLKHLSAGQTVVDLSQRNNSNHRPDLIA